ncbi:MAG: hypothetical protein IPO88_11940 [Nannocystis sp.]|uniref:hypothetical protein n=1 Tax=Nannocystis sp. TaxID=1962667 RepID=UPI00242A214E|nr:hypothetical protein [Nannocystis sp.]MBK9754196.1 hypothetical protein [Nannocystis sp.]
MSLRTAQPAARNLSLGTVALCLLLACKREAPGAAVRPAHPDTVVPAPAPDPCADTSIPPTTDEALARAAVLRRCGGARAVLAIYAELLQRDPRPRWAHELAALALAEGLVPEARELLQGPAARVGLALLHVAAFEARAEPADRDAARSEFQAALALAPDDPYALAVALRHDLALADREPERLALAAQICRERIVDDNPAADGGDPRGAALFVASCARVSLAAHEPGEARRRFALALTLDPDEPAPRLSWAAAELAAGNDRKAAELYAPALEAPAAVDRYLAGLGLGVARTRLHDPHGAEQAYRHAAAARDWHRGDPPERLPPELQFNLGSALAGPGDKARHAEARALLTAYVERPEADELRRLRCRQLLLELAD